jgi:hypothetical protein
MKSILSLLAIATYAVFSTGCINVERDEEPTTTRTTTVGTPAVSSSTTTTTY